MSSVLGLSFLFFYTWLYLSDKCHFNLVFSSSHVEPTYNLPSSNIILYILPFLYRLLNLLFVSSNVGCSLVTYLLFSSLKFRRMNSNFLVRDNAVYNCFLIYALDIIYIIVLIYVCTFVFIHCNRETEDKVFCKLSKVKPFTIYLNVNMFNILNNKLHLLKICFSFIFCVAIIGVPMQTLYFSYFKSMVSYFLFTTILYQHSVLTLILVAFR